MTARANYSIKEDQKMCLYLLQQLEKRNPDAKCPCGNKIWKQAKAENLFAGHSFQSLTTHMRRVVLPNLSTIPLPAEDIKKLQKAFKLKKSNVFVDDDDNSSGSTFSDDESEEIREENERDIFIDIYNRDVAVQEFESQPKEPAGSEDGSKSGQKENEEYDSDDSFSVVERTNNFAKRLHSEDDDGKDSAVFSISKISKSRDVNEICNRHSQTNANNSQEKKLCLVATALNNDVSLIGNTKPFVVDFPNDDKVDSQVPDTASRCYWLRKRPTTVAEEENIKSEDKIVNPFVGSTQPFDVSDDSQERSSSRNELFQKHTPRDDATDEETNTTALNSEEAVTSSYNDSKNPQSYRQHIIDVEQRDQIMDCQEIKDYLKQNLNEVGRERIETALEEIGLLCAMSTRYKINFADLVELASTCKNLLEVEIRVAAETSTKSL